MLLLCSACAQGTDTAVIRGDTYCDIAKPITWAPADTRPTIDQVRRHNAQHAKACIK
jgi:hypothetical protein